LAADVVYRGFQKKKKFGRLTEGALLYIRDEIGEI